MSWLVAPFVAVMVAAAWLATAGFARLRTPLDRLHCVTFANATCGTALLAAALAADGLSNRVGVMVLILALNLLGGAAGSYAVGRALRVRGSVPEAE